LGPEAGERFMIAAVFRVLAADSFVIGRHESIRLLARRAFPSDE
jgi:hypothetical protein